MFKNILMGLAAVFTVVLLGLPLIASEDKPQVVMGGPIAYKIPFGYHTSAHDGNISMMMSYPDFGPFEENMPGWDDNVLILINPVLSTTEVVFDHLYDGTPGIENAFTKIKKSYRYKSMTVHEMEAGGHIFVPDQDMKTMPIGFMRCGIADEVFKDPSCRLIFDQEGQKWNVTFGKRFLDDHQYMKEQVLKRMGIFKVGIKR